MLRRGFLVIAAMLIAGTSHAADAPDAATIAKQGLGDQVAPCTSCHGPAGGGNAAAGFPRLAGVGAAYLAAQLDAFASRARVNPVMRPIAKALSNTQRQALATYYSRLPVPSGDSSTARSDADKNSGRGHRLAEHGRWADGIPACVQCHGPGGVGVGERFPPLAGQPAGYIENQLKAWRNGKRPGGPMGLMAKVAAKLEDKDLAPVAEYFAALPAATSTAKESNHE